MVTGLHCREPYKQFVVPYEEVGTVVAMCQCDPFTFMNGIEAKEPGPSSWGFLARVIDWHELLGRTVKLNTTVLSTDGRHHKSTVCAIFWSASAEAGLSGGCFLERRKILGCQMSIDDDETATKLMPNVARLITGESDSLESKGSTSMSLCGNSEKDNNEVQNPELQPRNNARSRPRRGESVFQNVANKFLRKGAPGKRSKPSTFAALSPYYRVSSSSRSAHESLKGNVRPKEPTVLFKEGTVRSILEQKMVTRDTSQKVAKKFWKKTARSIFKLGQRRSINPKGQGAGRCITNLLSESHKQHAGIVTLPKASHRSHGSEGSSYHSTIAAKIQRGRFKLDTKTLPLNISELQEAFAKLDEEILEEEEVPRAHLTSIIRPALTGDSTVFLHHEDEIDENNVKTGNGLLRRNEGEDVASFTSNAKNEETTPSIYSCRLGDPRITLTSGRESEGSSQLSRRTAAQQHSKAKLNRKVTSLEMREIHDQCAQTYASEDIEFHERSSVHPRTTKPAHLSPVELKHADVIQGDIVEIQNEENQPRIREEGSVTPCLNGMNDEATHGRGVSHEHGQGDVEHVSTSQNMLSGTTGRDICDDMRITGPVKEGDVTTVAVFSLIDPVEIAIHSQSHDQRKVDLKTHPCQLKASTQELGGKGTRVCPALEVEHAEGGCRDKRVTADGPNANAAYREVHVPGRMSTFRGTGISAQSKVERFLEQGVPDIPLHEGAFSPRDTSATPPRNPLLLTGFQYSRKWRCIDMNQRRLAFESASESLSGDSISSDVSLPSVDFKGRINSAVDIDLNPDVQVSDANMTKILFQQETKKPITDVEVVGQAEELNCDINHDSDHLDAREKPRADAEEIGKVNGRDSISGSSSNPKTAMHCEGGVDTETLLTGSLAQNGNFPAFEASGVVEGDPGIDTSSLNARPAVLDCKKIRGSGKRPRTNLGAPIDGGSEWKEGRRVSTRIKSRPLEWWRGEKMLYGRVHSTLCTLIGIKTSSPDPVWPRPRPRREDYKTTNFHVVSFVDDNHCDLLRLAAQ